MFGILLNTVRPLGDTLVAFFSRMSSAMPAEMLLPDRPSLAAAGEVSAPSSVQILDYETPRPTSAFAALSRKLSGSSAIALTDQLIVSAGNFLTNILVARALPSDQWGVYALLLEAILFLNSIQAAVLVYPLTVRAALMNENDVRRFSGACTILTLLMAIPLGALLIGYGKLNGAAQIAVWAALAQTLWQCQEILRRTMLARGGFARALAGDIISYMGQALLIWLLIWGHTHNLGHIFAAMALTSLAASAIQGGQLKIRLTGLRGTFQIAASFWRMGRWVLLSTLSMFCSGVVCSYALTHWHGKQSMGEYAALGNLMRLANPWMITLSTLIVPAVAVANERSGLNAARRATIRLASGGGAMLVPYWALLYIFPEWCIVKMYPAQAEYHHLVPELRLFVASSIVTMLNIAVIAMFNGLHRSRRAMVGQLSGAVASLLVTIPLTYEYGLRGILFGTLASNSVISLVLLILSRRLHREQLAAELRAVAAG